MQLKIAAFTRNFELYGSPTGNLAEVTDKRKPFALQRRVFYLARASQIHLRKRLSNKKTKIARQRDMWFSFSKWSSKDHRQVIHF